MISFLELIEILRPCSLEYSKIEILNILKYLGINNPNCFGYIDFSNKVNAMVKNYNQKKSN